MPTAETRGYLIELVETLLNLLCESWVVYCIRNGWETSGRYVSLGYRRPRINKVLGGSSTSIYCYGYTLDLIPVNGQMRCF
mgnify:CR=1 FL=1